jgi:Flp pilus assembly CpaF family ATPase
MNSLRMRPDRIVVGECRGAEALEMLQAFNTGHDGFIETYAGLESCNAIDVATDIRDNAEEVAEAIAEAMEEYDGMWIPSSLEEELEENE